MANILNQQFEEHLNKMVEIFNKKERKFSAVLELLKSAENFLNSIYLIQLEGFDGRLITKWELTYYHLLDYYDIEHLSLNRSILGKFDKYCQKAVEKLVQEPGLSVLMLRLCVCAANINYRKKNFEAALRMIDKIKAILSLKEFTVCEPIVSPALMAELYFEEAKILVRLNRNSEAEPLFNKAVRKYEDWENRKRKGDKISLEFKNFITYRICVTQAFSIYSQIQQGKIESVVREAWTIERLLEYTTHQKLQRFVRTLRAKAIRLSGFSHPNQLRTVIKLLRDNQFYTDAKKPVQGEIVKEGNFVFYNYQRHFLMNLYQQGLSYYYLLHSVDKNDRQQENEIIDELRKIIETIRYAQIKNKSADNYWIIKANLLEIYCKLFKKNYETAFNVAKQNAGLECEHLLLKIESQVALAEVGVGYLKLLNKQKLSNSQPANLSTILKEVQTETRTALDRCEEVEAAFNNSGQRNPKKVGSKESATIFALYYLLKCDFFILEGEFEKAKIFWKKWSEVEGDIELSRWQSLANEIKDNLDNAEDKLTIDFTKSFKYKPAKIIFDNWLYQRVKRKFGTDVASIKALDISREKFYNMKEQYEETVGTLSEEKEVKKALKKGGDGTRTEEV